jgi:hypothetical protein
MVEVVVPTNKLVEERGWRIDQVQDRKLVEVEEHRKFRLVPEPTGEVHIADKRCGIWLLRRHALHDSRPLQIEPCLLLLLHGWSWLVRTCDDAANSAALLGSTSLAPEVLVLCPLDRRVPGFSIERPFLAQARSTRTRKTSGAFPTTANRTGPAISPTGSSTPAYCRVRGHRFPCGMTQPRQLHVTTVHSREAHIPVFGTCRRALCDAAVLCGVTGARAWGASHLEATAHSSAC